MKRLLGIACLIAFLSGCSGLNSNFNCNKVDGIGTGCTSMQSVNQMADEGRFVSDNDASLKKAATPKKLMLPPGLAIDAPHPGDPVRFSESIQQIWIAPYEDKQGNYHEPSLIYTVIYPAHWIGVTEKDIQEDEED